MVTRSFALPYNLFQTYLLLLFLLPFRLAGQHISETLIHFDKSFYVTGETVWFKLYLPEDWRNRNVAVNTKVLNNLGEIEDQFFVKSGGNDYISGYYLVPFDHRSGYYEFQFYASRGPEVPEDLIAYYPVAVYNDLEQSVNLPSGTNDDIPEVSKVLSDDLSVDLNLVTKEVRCRDEVSVHVSIRDKNGNPVSGHASVSIKDGALSKPMIKGIEIMTSSITHSIMPTTLIADLYCRGKLTAIDGSALQMNVLGGYVSQDERIYYSKSFSNGLFQINLPDFTGNKAIQLLGFQYEKPDLQSHQDAPVLMGEKMEIRYSEAVLEYLRLSRLRKKIFQYYEMRETDFKGEEIKIEPQELAADATYLVKEYESFKDIKSFFGELLTPLRFRLEKDSTYSASLFNAKGGKRSNTILNGPPLFMIDGKVTRNADFIARLPISAIQKVELFLDTRKLRGYFQAIGVSGLVKISTTIANLKLPPSDAGNIHRIYGLQPKAVLTPFNPDILKDRQPFFRPQLYWNPELSVNQEGKSGFSFFQSDDTGTFEITVVFQADDGRRATGSYQYQVAF